jgi:hypothetical protein
MREAKVISVSRRPDFTIDFDFFSFIEDTIKKLRFLCNSFIIRMYYNVCENHLKSIQNNQFKK